MKKFGLPNFKGGEIKACLVKRVCIARPSELERLLAYIWMSGSLMNMIVDYYVVF